MSRQIRNFVINNEHRTQFDEHFIEVLFGPLDDNETIEEMGPETTVWDILVLCEIFPSKSQARKNWKHGELKPGWNDFNKIGKLNHWICVFVPLDFSSEIKCKHCANLEIIIPDNLPKNVMFSSPKNGICKLNNEQVALCYACDKWEDVLLAASELKEIPAIPVDPSNLCIECGAERGLNSKIGICEHCKKCNKCSWCCWGCYKCNCETIFCDHCKGCKNCCCCSIIMGLLPYNWGGYNGDLVGCLSCGKIFDGTSLPLHSKDEQD